MKTAQKCTNVQDIWSRISPQNLKNWQISEKVLENMCLHLKLVFKNMAKIFHMYEIF